MTKNTISSEDELMSTLGYTDVKPASVSTGKKETNPVLSFLRETKDMIPGPVMSAGVGAAKGVTANFFDYVPAAGAYLAKTIQGQTTPIGQGKPGDYTFNELLNASRGVSKDIEAENPLSSLAGRVVGGTYSLTRTGINPIAGNALYGGLAAAGQGGTGSDIATGTALGGLFGTLGQGSVALSKWMGSKFAKKIAEETGMSVDDVIGNLRAGSLAGKDGYVGWLQQLGMNAKDAVKTGASAISSSLIPAGFGAGVGYVTAPQGYEKEGMAAGAGLAVAGAKAKSAEAFGKNMTEAANSANLMFPKVVPNTAKFASRVGTSATVPTVVKPIQEQPITEDDLIKILGY